MREEGSGRTDRQPTREPERDPDEPITQTSGDVNRARSGRTDLETQVNLYVLKGPDPDEPISKPKFVIDRARSGRTDLETRV